MGCKTNFKILSCFLAVLAIAFSCTRPEKAVQEPLVWEAFMNHHDSARYVGMQQCRECHPLIYDSYMRTGMGRSFGRATPSKSASIIGPDSLIYDQYSNLWYRPFWQGDVLMLEEFRIENGDTVHRRLQQVDYIVGSGHHTNSHIYVVNGYAYQIPFTYYTQVHRFDLPPGFEGGHNSRFGRSLGLECISCHNGLPQLVPGSENKYVHMPEGIDCERCHGPGSIHVALKKKGILVDTARFADYSIVNPKWLPKQLQNDVCARCHLQGTIVLKNNRSFYDYRPGIPLTTVMDVFLPVFEGGTEDLIMASHVERMMESRCFMASGGDLSCMQCHNPHLSVKETPRSRFNKACISCHHAATNSVCSKDEASRLAKNNDCALCHMPVRKSRDIPHVMITDHKIINPEREDKRPRAFKGLKAINNPRVDAFTKGLGYLREYETYHANPAYLDSAARLLRPSPKRTDTASLIAFVQYFFLRKEFKNVIRLVERNGGSEAVARMLHRASYDNLHAWTAYRIGQSFENEGLTADALVFFGKTIELAPYQLDFLNRYGSLLARLERYAEAAEVFAGVIAENPLNDMAHVNLGWCLQQQGRMFAAHESYTKALQLNPDNLQALLNLAGYHLSTGMPGLARPLLRRAMHLAPARQDIRNLLDQIGG
ncbi:MAG: tetratricopeptide repeat protein [Bacteroidetes bacterium]|nr:tetratricopeptide repeat protein [Bacteroidota bacterium]